MIRSLRVIVPLTVIVLGLVGVASLQPRQQAQAATGGVVEVVERVHVSGGTVERHTYVDTSAAGAATAATAPGGGVTAQYNVNPWRWAVASMPVVVRVNTTKESPRPPLTPAVQNAIDQWSSVTPTTFRFVLGPDTTAGPGLCDNDAHGNPDPHPDGVNVVTYENLRAGFLGLTCSYQPDDAPHLQSEFDTELAYGVDWGAGNIAANQYDLWSTVLHEMGHAAGMGHSCFSSTTCVGSAGDAVMNFALSRGKTKRVLTDDDKQGLRTLYPLTGPTIPTPTPLPQFEHNFVVQLGSLARTE